MKKNLIVRANDKIKESIPCDNFSQAKKIVEEYLGQYQFDVAEEDMAIIDSQTGAILARVSEDYKLEELV